MQWVLDELELINPGVEKSVRQIEQKLKYMKYHPVPQKTSEMADFFESTWATDFSIQTLA